MPGGLGNPKTSIPARTWGKESVLCPRSFTTVSEELEVEELISFTMSPAQRRVEKVILGVAQLSWGPLLLAVGTKDPSVQCSADPSAQQLCLQPALPTKHPKSAPKWHPKLSPGSLASPKTSQ